ncbi:MAG: hypothetical protein ACE5IP_02345 [Terriglobia bacterium]
MEETQTQPTEAAADKPVIHRVCEACNNMFATHAGANEKRCPNCRKE